MDTLGRGVVLSMRSLWLYHAQEVAQIEGKVSNASNLVSPHIHILHTELKLVSEPEGLCLLQNGSSNIVDSY